MPCCAWANKYVIKFPVFNDKLCLQWGTIKFLVFNDKSCFQWITIRFLVFNDKLCFQWGRDIN